MKKLGQHFLTNRNKLQKIVEVLDLKPSDTVIEIGSGHGELTDELRIKNYELRIIAIEKDDEFVQCLQKKFAQDKNIEIVKGDALRILPSIIHNSLLKIQNYKIVGNIPFYITGRLLRILGELAASPKRGEPRPEISGRENKPSLIVLTVQKEVAERICAEPPRMNLLAASVQFWAEPEIIDYIPKTDFQPQPKVDSAVIKLSTYSPRSSEGGAGNLKLKTSEIENYYQLIKILFKQPRKTILNNLVSSIKHQVSKGKNKEEIIKKLKMLGINPQDRPQNLSVEQIKELSKIF